MDGVHRASRLAEVAYWKMMPALERASLKGAWKIFHPLEDGDAVFRPQLADAFRRRVSERKNFSARQTTIWRSFKRFRCVIKWRRWRMLRAHGKKATGWRIVPKLEEPKRERGGDFTIFVSN